MKNNPKIINAWTFYDWANSVYSLVITSAIFPAFFMAQMKNFSGEEIKVLSLKPESAFNLSLAISFLIVIILSPILSAIADVIGNKLKFLKFFCYLGSISCMMLFFFYNANYATFALIFNVLASVGFWGSLVFYNSYLPEIATKDTMDNVSAKGFIKGYIGSVLLLALCLVLIFSASDDNKILVTRICFLLTGIWWISFAQITFRALPNNSLEKEIPKSVLFLGFKEFNKVFKELYTIPMLKIFLSAFFFYSFGMQTIFLMASVFGEKILNLPTQNLILTVLLIQIEAIFGAWLFNKLSKITGNRNTLLFGIFIWIIVCIIGYSIQKQVWLFYVTAALIGLVMGGIQALSRSTYSKLLPETEDTTTFFSFYDVFEKLALFLGLITFFLFTEFGKGMKQAVLAMGFSFAISFLIMIFLPKYSQYNKHK